MTENAEQGADGFPKTYAPLSRRDGVRQIGVFDPALKQFVNAYRAGEPVFDDPALGEAWHHQRNRVMTQVLRAIASSPAADHLVLRGSMLMRSWLGAAARRPGDLDWVVIPATMMLGESDCTRLLADVLAAITPLSTLDDDARIDGTRIDVTRPAMEDLWTYERAPGRRLVLPWTSSELPPGVVQMDFVFNEQLPQEPRLTEVVTTGSQPVEVLAASPELSLAWKLLWLETDSYPQGKDLYDATVLAERYTVPVDLLRQVLGKELGAAAVDFSPASVLEWDVDWHNFIGEYPDITGTVEQWQRRLAAALRATFDGQS
jgi:hypothetical protein